MSIRNPEDVGQSIRDPGSKSRNPRMWEFLFPLKRLRIQTRVLYQYSCLHCLLGFQLCILVTMVNTLKGKMDPISHLIKNIARARTMVDVYTLCYWRR